MIFLICWTIGGLVFLATFMLLTWAEYRANRKALDASAEYYRQMAKIFDREDSK